MCDREGPSGSGSQGGDKGDGKKSTSQPIPTGSRYFFVFSAE